MLSRQVGGFQRSHGMLQTTDLSNPWVWHELHLALCNKNGGVSLCTLALLDVRSCGDRCGVCRRRARAAGPVARCGAVGSGFGVCVQWLRLHFTSRTLELSTRNRWNFQACLDTLIELSQSSSQAWPECSAAVVWFPPLTSFLSTTRNTLALRPQ